MTCEPAVEAAAATATKIQESEAKAAVATATKILDSWFDDWRTKVLPDHVANYEISYALATAYGFPTGRQARAYIGYEHDVVRLAGDEPYKSAWLEALGSGKPEPQVEHIARMFDYRIPGWEKMVNEKVIRVGAILTTIAEKNGGASADWTLEKLRIKDSKPIWNKIVNGNTYASWVEEWKKRMHDEPTVGTPPAKMNTFYWVEITKGQHTKWSGYVQTAEGAVINKDFAIKVLKSVESQSPGMTGIVEVAEKLWPEDGGKNGTVSFNIGGVNVGSASFTKREVHLIV